VSRIDRVEVHEFEFEARNLARDGVAQTVTYAPGSTIRVARYAVVVRTVDGGRGEYVTHWVANRSSLGQTLVLAPRLGGKDARERIAIYEDLKRDVRQYDHMGHGPIDIALWDWAGKRYGAPIAELLGGYRKRLPAYASTYHGDRRGGLASKEAFAGFAEQCHALGYRAFKVHGWNDGNAREEAANVLHVAKVVGDRMTLMLDPACELRTFADALHVGRACDEAGYFWYEDRSVTRASAGHKRLRDIRRRCRPSTCAASAQGRLIVAGGTDYVRVDPEFDHGITGTMKIAHLPGLGLDASLPAGRRTATAWRDPQHERYEVLVGAGAEHAAGLRLGLATPSVASLAAGAGGPGLYYAGTGSPHYRAPRLPGRIGGAPDTLGQWTRSTLVGAGVVGSGGAPSRSPAARCWCSGPTRSARKPRRGTAR
jgi:L-alanine-DL-glutamate epimerase-like enolase superfamily enzyme